MPYGQNPSSGPSPEGRAETTAVRASPPAPLLQGEGRLPRTAPTTAAVVSPFPRREGGRGVRPGKPLLFALTALLVTTLLAHAAQAPRRLTHDGKRKEDLTWSPDGKRLACSLYHQTGRIGIGVMDPDGGNLKVLTTDPVERAPAWSPDGKRIAFVHVTQSGTDGELDLWVMNADGGERKPLVKVEGKAFDNFPAWSPDGKQLVFTTTRDKTQELYVADGSGENFRRLTSDPALKQYPRWSPNGERLLYNANPDGNFDLYVIDAAGGTPRRLTEDPAMDVCPAWSPDGKRVAWVSLRDDNPEIYVMELESGEKSARNVSDYPGYDYSPAWRPDGALTWVSDRDGRFDVYESTR